MTFVQDAAFVAHRGSARRGTPRFRRLDDFLDHELTPEETTTIAEHLEVCAVCASEFTFEQSVLDGVKRKLGRLEVAKDLVARILSRIHRAPGRGLGRGARHTCGSAARV